MRAATGAVRGAGEGGGVYNDALYITGGKVIPMAKKTNAY